MDAGNPAARAMAVLSPEAREAYLLDKSRRNSAPRERYKDIILEYQHDLVLERKFVEVGCLLLAGPDPTGNGGIIAGFDDLREIELLVEAGFSPEQAIKIATYNGAFYLGLQDRIGSVAVGKNADLVVVNGDPSTSIADIEKVEIVFKDGVPHHRRRMVQLIGANYFDGPREGIAGYVRCSAVNRALLYGTATAILLMAFFLGERRHCARCASVSPSRAPHGRAPSEAVAVPQMA